MTVGRINIVINKNKLKIGFIGQGFIGKNYANDFKNRGYEVIGYSQEKEYAGNKDKIKQCDIVFVAVPTPTTLEGFDGSIVRKVIKLVGKGKIAVIKSTILPGMTELIQKENPNIFVLHSPEFLSEITALNDAAYPKRNIVGIPIDNNEYRKKAKQVMGVLAKAPYNKICSTRESELVKYGRNCLGYVKIIFTNLLYDLAKELGADWEVIREVMSADPDTGPTYMNPIHKTGRGAGGHCFIKDFSAFIELYKKITNDPLGLNVLKSIEEKNISLLEKTNKDLDILCEVYGKKKK